MTYVIGFCVGILLTTLAVYAGVWGAIALIRYVFSWGHHRR